MVGDREVFPGVVVDPATHHGRPVLKGTRLAVEVILGALAAGETIEAVCAAYAITPEQVRAAMGYAADRVAAETTYVVTSQ